MKKILNHPILFGFLATLVALILGQLLASLVSSMLAQLLGLSELGYTACDAAVYLLVAFLFFRFCCRRENLNARFSGSRQQFGTAAVLLIPLLAEILMHCCYLFPSIPWAELSYAHVLRPLVIGLRPGVTEELIFRGLVLGNMMRLWQDRKWGIHASVILSALIFALVHFVGLTGQGFWETVTQVLFCIPFGLLAGAVYARTHCLIPLIAAHVFFDAILMFMIQFPAAEGYTGNGTLQLMIYLFWLGWGLFLIRPSRHDRIRTLWKETGSS